MQSDLKQMTDQLKLTPDDHDQLSREINFSRSNPEVFITRWQVSKRLRSILLPLWTDGKYDFYVEWGDGSDINHITHVDQKETVHTYKSPGYYEVRIVGVLQGFTFNSDVWKPRRYVGKRNFPGYAYKRYPKQRKKQIVDIIQWGNIGLGCGGQQFKECLNLQITARDAPNLTFVTDLNHIFAKLTNFNGNLSHWNLSNITDVSFMFYGARKFTCNISSWDTRNVQIATGMFQNAYSFNSDISDWDVSKIKFASHMFHDAHSFKTDLSHWNVSSLTKAIDMLNGVHSDFNLDCIDAWNPDNYPCEHTSTRTCNIVSTYLKSDVRPKHHKT